MILKQIVPLPLVQNILPSSAHQRTTKILEKVHSRFYCLGYKRDVEVIVASCFVFQKRNSPTKKHIHSLKAWKPSFPFSTVSNDFLGLLPFFAGTQYILLIGDHLTRWHEAIA